MTKKQDRLSHWKPYFNIVFYFALLASMLAFALLQPFGDPPDEVNRYKIAQFVCRYGALPTGEEFEVAIGGYGGSYAFQPILPYIVQGFLMRLLSSFTKERLSLLLCARMVNVLFGVIMAVYIRRLSVLLFQERTAGWLFCFLIMFLPQNLFLHSYVNTDSMASMSGAIILYACVSGMQSGWRRRDCLTLCAGIVCCALSYYNAYGLIVTAILLFFISHLNRRPDGRLAVDWNGLLRKGLMISAIVLLGIGWWFIRNYIIHEGDFLGLQARIENSIRTALPEYNPASRVTVAASGASLTDMLFHMDFLYFLWNSFVARFGPMTLPTLPFLYIWYYRIFFWGFVFALLPPAWVYRARETAWKECGSRQKAKALCESGDARTIKGLNEQPQRLLFHLAMLLAILITFSLCVYYSYTSDYQPQGRYIMPMLIPFMYFVTLGFDKLSALFTNRLPFAVLRKWSRPVIMGGLLFFLSGALFLTIVCVVIPHYAGGVNLWNAAWISF